MASLVLVIGTMHRYDNGSIDRVWTSIYVQKMTQKRIRHGTMEHASVFISYIRIYELYVTCTFSVTECCS